MRPRTLVIHDNLKKEIFYISNVFNDEKIKNYQKKYDSIKTDLFKLLIQSSIKNIDTKKSIKKKKKLKLNQTHLKINFLQWLIKLRNTLNLVIFFKLF